MTIAIAIQESPRAADVSVYKLHASIYFTPPAILATFLTSPTNYPTSNIMFATKIAAFTALALAASGAVALG